jgi:hypothetical protein
MRKSILFIAAFSPLAIFAGLALPVAAESPGAAAVSEPAGEVLDLDAIPIKPVTGHQSITGVAVDDEDDDMPGIGEDGDQDRHAEMGGDDDGSSGDDDGNDD